MKTKNVFLTLWLAAPILTVGLLTYWIFSSFDRRDEVVKPRAVGAGANDTGGANAIGEWLAGRDPDEVQRIKRDLREGRLVDPTAWPGGVRVVISHPGLSDFVTLMDGPESETGGSIRVDRRSTDDQITLTFPAEWFAQGGSQAYAYFGYTSIYGNFPRGIATLGDGTVLDPLPFGPVPADQVPDDRSQPIIIQVEITERHDDPTSG